MEGKRLFTTQKKVIRIMANAQKRELVDHYLSSSVHHQLASEYIQSLLYLRRICGNS